MDEALETAETTKKSKKSRTVWIGLITAALSSITGLGEYARSTIAGLNERVTTQAQTIAIQEERLKTLQEKLDDHLGSVDKTIDGVSIPVWNAIADIKNDFKDNEAVTDDLRSVVLAHSMIMDLGIWHPETMTQHFEKNKKTGVMDKISEYFSKKKKKQTDVKKPSTWKDKESAEDLKGQYENKWLIQEQMQTQETLK